MSTLPLTHKMSSFEELKELSKTQQKEYVWEEAFIDYDESDDEFSKEVRKTRYGKSLIERLTYFTAKKATIDADDNYFQAHETRYAQTITLRKRHTPAFQIFIDCVIFMAVALTFLGTVVFYYRRYLRLEMEDAQAKYVWHRNVYLEFIISAILLAKAICGCLWYHYYAKANRVDLTAEIYLIRLIFDLLILTCCILYYVFAGSAVMTLAQLITVIVLIVGFDVTVAYTCVWRAHEKLKQKRFESSLRNVMFRRDSKV